MSYINKDRLCEDLITRWETADKDKENEILNIMVNIVIPIVVGQPSADVRENVHGEWIEGEEFLFCGETYTAGDKCSVCGRTAMGYPWHFCPNCGADMRGGETK